MDEWGQIVTMDLLQRYVRKFFRDPRLSFKKGGEMSAEVVDRQRRVVRSIREDGTVVVGGSRMNPFKGGGGGDLGDYNLDDDFYAEEQDHGDLNSLVSGAHSQATISTKGTMLKMKQQKKKRVVRKGFYSDDEDQSSE